MQLSRISKLFVDRDDVLVERALARRESHRLSLICGSDVGGSYTLQLAVLTASQLATRCFPGAVRVSLDERLANSPLLLWPRMELTVGQALSGIVGRPGLEMGRLRGDELGRSVVFGNGHSREGAMRVTFDRWIAAAGPATVVERLPEDEGCPLSGILAASIVMSEIFMSFAEISVEAMRRGIAMSLWRPDGDADGRTARGKRIEYLPKRLWVMGLGHLGNAYLWALGSLPYRSPREVEVILNDFDRVEPENVETGVLFREAACGLYKTRVCADWVERRGFRSRIVERRFDEHFRCGPEEPGLAFCGFDKNSARRPLATAGFRRVVECGLGGAVGNFDVISAHSLPNSRSAEELWPDVPAVEEAAERQRRARVARESKGYAGLDSEDCGRMELAGKSVAVPFVGTAAASLVVGEAIRAFHGGPAYEDVKMRLSVPHDVRTTPAGAYGTQEALLGFTASQGS